MVGVGAVYNVEILKYITVIVIKLMLMCCIILCIIVLISLVCIMKCIFLFTAADVLFYGLILYKKHSTHESNQQTTI